MKPPYAIIRHRVSPEFIGSSRKCVPMAFKFTLSMEMSRLTRDGTAEPVSRDQIIRRIRGQGDIHVWGFRFSMLDWVRIAGLSCTKGVWYIYDRDTG